MKEEKRGGKRANAGAKQKDNKFVNYSIMIDKLELKRLKSKYGKRLLKKVRELLSRV